MVRSNIVPLSERFFARDPAVVARVLLGHHLVSTVGRTLCVGRIVETEAYYGPRDPASRAYRRVPMSEPMFGPPGTAFVYMVHARWLFNVVCGRLGEPAAVLLRAVEPQAGLDAMRRRRGPVEERDLCRGPGRLTEAMGITRDHNRGDVTDPGTGVYLARGSPRGLRVARSGRIGVSRDLRRPLRFYVEGSPWVSR